MDPESDAKPGSRKGDAAPKHAAPAHIPGTPEVLEENARHAGQHISALQVQKMEALARLSGGLSHDFNNLLTVAIGNLAVLSKMQPLPEAAHELIATALNAFRRGTECGNLFSANPQRRAQDRSLTDLNPVVERAVASVRPRGRDRNKLTVSRASSLPAASIDAERFEDAVAAVLENAWEATPPDGEIIIETFVIDHLPSDAISAYNSDSPHICVRVRDTGPGMPISVLERAFDPYFTTKADHGGRGLGLTSVYQIIQQARGAITARSTPGWGTEICLYLPIPKSAPKLEATNEKNEGKAGRVLVIEDQPDVRDTLHTMITGLGYAVEVAVSGMQALRFLADRGPYSVVVTDLVLPGLISGYDIAEKARSMDQKTGVMMMSGYAPDPDLLEDLMGDNSKFLHKPVELEALERTLADLGRANTEPDP